MRISARAGYRRMAWKNGKGVTEEVASFPASGDVNGFEWRLSIAHVGCDGPFSVFSGIDRTIALLEGAGLTLHLPDGTAVALVPGGPPFTFPGELEIYSSNTNGATIDLNIMTRRASYTHAMERQVLAAGSSFVATHPGWVVFNASAQITTDGGLVQIGRFDALQLRENESFVNVTGTAVEILCVQVVAVNEQLDRPGVPSDLAS